MATAATRMTLDEFLALPEEKPYREFVRGEVIEKPMPGPDHSALVLEVGGQIREYLKAHREVARVDTELRHAARGDEDRVYLPDVSVTLKSRFPAGQRRGPIEVHPDIAVEVLSPDDRATVINDKIQFYLRAGVSIVWVVDPEARTLTEYRPDGPSRQFRAPGRVSGAPVLPGFALDLAALFDVLDDGTA
jgi:Uma2 family endonuclease